MGSRWAQGGRGYGHERGILVLVLDGARRGCQSGKELTEEGAKASRGLRACPERFPSRKKTTALGDRRGRRLFVVRAKPTVDLGWTATRIQDNIRSKAKRPTGVACGSVESRPGTVRLRCPRRGRVDALFGAPDLGARRFERGGKGGLACRRSGMTAPERPRPAGRWNHPPRMSHRSLLAAGTSRRLEERNDAGGSFLSVVVPAKNEAASLGQLVEEITCALRPLRGDRPGELDGFEIDHR